MRFAGDYEENFAGQWALWEKNLRRNFSGKPGQAILRELREALLALPEKRLIQTRLADEQGNVCTLGALAAYRAADRTAELVELAELIEEEGDFIDEWEAQEQTLAVARGMGVKTPMAVELAYINDDGPHEETPEARYERVLRYLDKVIL